MRWPAFLLAAAVVTLAAGCSSGPRLVRAKGTLTEKGKPVQVGPREGVTLVFIPADKGETYDTFPARLNRADATFVVEGRDGRGIPEGKYRVAVTKLALSPTPAARRLNERFSPAQTPLVCAVTSPEAPIVLDLSRTTQ